MKVTRRQLKRLIIEGLSNTPETINREEHLSRFGTWKVVINHYAPNQFVGQLYELARSGFNYTDEKNIDGMYGLVANTRRSRYHGYGGDYTSKLDVILDLRDQITQGSPFFMGYGQNGYDELSQLLSELERI